MLLLLICLLVVMAGWSLLWFATKRRSLALARVRASAGPSYETLEAREMLTTAPVLEALDDVTLLSGSPLHIPLNASDAEGGPLTFSATSDNTSVTTFIPEGNRSWRVSVTNFGDLVFELFEGRAPRATERIIELAESGFYEDIIFHRVINDFVIQGGDPTGTGTGGSTLGDFDDQFHLDLQHNRTGLLSKAKSFDDTNDSQFFVTEGPSRFLDFNHTIFGLLVEGEDVRAAISDVPTGAGDRPLTDVVIESTEVFVDQNNGVLMLRAPEGFTGTAEVAVMVTDADGNQATRTFTVTVTPDTVANDPFLADVPRLETTVDTEVTHQLTHFDAEGDSTFFLDEARLLANGFRVPEASPPDLDYTVDFDTGLLTVTPSNGITGTFGVWVATGTRSGPISNPEAFLDYQRVEIYIGQATEARTELTIVHEPTATDSLGEVAVSPASDNWVDEWQTFWVEVWLDTPGGTDTPITSASFDLDFDHRYLDATEIEYGPSFTLDQEGTISNSPGLVRGLSARTDRTDLGDNAKVLFARVRFEVTEELPLNADGHHIEPIDLLTFELQDREIESTTGPLSLADNQVAEAHLFPVMYDLDNSGQIGFSDLAIFAASFLQDVGGQPSSFAADFDRSGRVDFADLSLLSANFLRSNSDSVELIYASNFPDAWLPDNLVAAFAADPLALSAPSLDPSAVTPLLAEASQRVALVLGEDVLPTLSSVDYQVVDLPGQTLAQYTQDQILIDVNAAGHGWFVDPTPGSDEEFDATGRMLDSADASRIDLLTALMHELSHASGLEHSDADDLLAPALEAGRRLSLEDADFAATVDTILTDLAEQDEASQEE